MMIWLFGCHPTSSISQVADIIERVSVDPTLAKTECPNISQTVHHDECWLVALDQMRNASKRDLEDICHMLSEKSGECWFRVAEKSNDATYCTQAAPFELDCRHHQLSRWLFRNQHTDWPTMTEHAQSVGLDITREETLTILYRHLLSQNPSINPALCQESQHPALCLRAGTGMYRDRLRFAESQHQFPCDVPTNDPLFHHQDSNLLTIYQEFSDANCLE